MALPQKRSSKHWVWTAWDRAPGRLFDWELGRRDRTPLERLLERLKRWGVRLSCADGLNAYAVPIPQGLLYVGKEETTIKCDHARQPHGLVRIRRHSIVVPETRRRGDASMALFARFARNTSIRDLVSMLV